MPFNKAEIILRIKTFKHIFQLSLMFFNITDFVKSMHHDNFFTLSKLKTVPD